jgi:hypothetical protein
MKSQFTTIKEETDKELAKPLTAADAIVAAEEASEELKKASMLDSMIVAKQNEMTSIYDSCFDSGDWSNYDLLDGELEVLKNARKALLI